MMTRRTIKVVCLVTLASLLLLLSALPAPAQTSSPKWPKLITLAGGGSTTLGYLAAVGLANEIKSKLGIPFTVTTGGGTIERLRLIARGDADIVTASGFVARQAFRGEASFAKVGRQAIRALPLYYTTGMMIISMARSNINSIPDLKGKKFMCLSKSIPQYEIMITRLFELHEMTIKDVVALSGQPIDRYEGLFAGTVDALATAGGLRGNASVVDLSRQHDLRFYYMTDTEMKQILKKEPYLSWQVTPAGTYKGQDKDLNQPAMTMFFACRQDLLEDLGYEISKILLADCELDSPGKMKKYSPNLVYTMSNIQDFGSKGIVPFHPGAVKYLKEKGVWTAEMEKTQKELLAQ